MIIAYIRVVKWQKWKVVGGVTGRPQLPFNNAHNSPYSPLEATNY